MSHKIFETILTSAEFLTVIGFDRAALMRLPDYILIYVNGYNPTTVGKLREILKELDQK